MLAIRLKKFCMQRQQKIDAVKPKVAAGLFADDEVEDEVETETGETEE